ncbi:MAG: hypothetical protein AAFX99_26640, partial [Myxococcota bacterium]
LASMDDAQLGGQQVTYRCAACHAAYQPGTNRCLACGTLTLYGTEGQPLITTSEEVARAEQVVVSLLEQLGYVPSQLFVGGHTWRLTSYSGSPLWLKVDDEGQYIKASAPLVRLPAEHFEGFYRFLLTVNDVETGDCRLSIEGESVCLGFAVPTAFLRLDKMQASLERLLDLSEAIADILREGWSCDAPPTQALNEGP